MPLSQEQKLAKFIFSIIKHGDKEHRAWLKTKSLEVSKAWTKKGAKK